MNEHPMKFLHTADWQMGMRAESVGKMAERVREERLAAAQRVVQAARDHNAEMLLLTGFTPRQPGLSKLKTPGENHHWLTVLPPDKISSLPKINPPETLSQRT